MGTHFENTSRPANVRTGRPGPPQKPSASGFCGERRRKEAHAVFTARWKRREADFAPTKCAAAGRFRRGWGFVPGERLSKTLFRQSRKTAVFHGGFVILLRSLAEFVPAGTKKYNLFSATACTWTKTLLGPQTCELAVWGPHKIPAQRVLWGEEAQGSAHSFHRQVETEGSGLCADEVRCRGPRTPSPERLCLFGEVG